MHAFRLTLVTVHYWPSWALLAAIFILIAGVIVAEYREGEAMNT